MTVKMKRNSQHFSGDESDTRLSKKIKSKKNRIPSSDEDSEQEDTVDVIEETEFHEMEEPVARHKGKKREIDSDDEEEEEADSEEVEDIVVSSSRAKAKRRINKLEYNDGTIEKISLKNFMCHQNLVIDFGENLNFIIGQNGSGKSAILTAIIIALGGKANFTNRGSSIKTFLKSGSSDGSIKIQICNKGSDPFKYEEYGDSVIVERRITANSGNTLRMSTIKDGKETTVSTKREELELMKDHMQISMDNPLTILTQDTSRSFLSNASSKELYKFFMRGTLLAQLEEDYKKLDDDISATASEIDRHTTVIIPEIKAEVSVLSTKWKALEHARNIDDRINALNRQLVWAEIQSKEEHVEGMKERCETAQQKVQEKLQQVEELNGEIDAKKLQIEKINIQVEKAEESFAPLQARENEMKKELKEHQLLLGTLKNHKDNINEDVKRLKLQVSTHQKNIDAEAAKLAKNSKSVREQKIKDIDNDKKRLAETKNDISDLQNQQLMNEQKLEEISNEVKILEDDKHQKSMEIQTRKTSIEKLTREKNDKLISYGQEMRDVLRAIDDYDRQGKWRGRKPIGPFGQYIELKQDCKEYGKVIESHLNNTLNGLGVDNHEDMKLLQNVLRQYRCRSSVSKYSTKNIDYSRSQPDQSFLTILRCINVQDQYVLNHLIISEKIEKTILVATQREGDDLTYNGYPNQCAAVLTKNCENVGSSQGGLSVRNIREYNGPPRLSADVKEYIEDEKIKLRSLSEDARNSEMALRAKLEEKNSLRNQIYMMKNQINQLEKTAGALERGINHKQASIQEDDPTTIAHYEEEKKRVEGSINVLHQQFADVHSQIVEQDEHIKHVTDDIAKVRREKEGFATKLEEARQRKSQFEKDYHRLESKKSDVFRKYQQYQSYVEDKAKPAYEKACEDLEKQVEEASSQCARVKVTMPTDKLLKQIKKEEAMKIAATEEHGDVYDIHNQLKERKAALKFTIRSTNNIVKVNEALRESYTVRIKDFAHFKSSIIAQSKQLFGEKMAARGFRGKLKVNCAEEILELIVDVNESTAKKKGSKKLKAGDIKSLSGGEKSYSTICLLLALWDAMDVPFRALDEFDVFMDAVNRRLCMKLMMDNAREKDKKTQYIFITPQDMSHVNLQGTDVKIIRMMDPNRRATQN